MQTDLNPELLATDAGQEADAILRACVHCGFCLPTCPTYALGGNELDSPRGRIWLIKDMLEQDAATQITQQHLDRCLTCRACETTCPSGVRYGRLLEIGRAHLDARVPRGRLDRLLRGLLVRLVPYRARFAPFLRAGQWLRPLLPGALRDKVPRLPRRARWATPRPQSDRQVVLLAGCVQSLATPATNRATAAVLGAVGIRVTEARGVGCCGALPHHLNDLQRSRAMARRNIDQWWPMLTEGGAEALVMTASGCGVQVRDYGDLLRDEPAYAERAAEVARRTVDLAEFLTPDMLGGVRAAEPLRVAWHAPCTLQHGQQVTGRVETLLDALGHQRLAVAEAHLCCGSAGTYSLLQPERAGALRERKVAALQAGQPDVIVTANVGCQTHLANGTRTPVRHWIELVADAL